MQRWLKRITPDRHSLEKLWCLRPFASHVVDPGCWTFHRRSVIRAFSLGLLIAFIPPTPFLPVHLITCTVLGILFRLNLPVLIATVFLSNPLTWLPQIMGSIWVGSRLLDLDLVPLMRTLNRENLWSHLNQLWAPLLLGSLVLGLITSAVGYVLAQCAWRLRVLYLWRKRRSRNAARASRGADRSRSKHGRTAPFH